MTEFKMPSLGADMTDGTLIQWIKKPGDQVKRGDIIAEVDTDKGVIEVEVFADGVIEKLLIAENENVPVGTTLAIIMEEGAINGHEKAPVADEPAEPAEPKRVVASPSARKIAKKLGIDLTMVTGSGHMGRIQRKDVESAAAGTKKIQEKPVTDKPVRIVASPAARKLAKKLGVDLTGLAGSGPAGRIQRKDVESAAAKNTAVIQATADQQEKPDQKRGERMRSAIAAAMERSKREIPHYYLESKIEMDRALDWLSVENAKRSIKNRILCGVLLLKAVSLALRELPEFNGIWEDGRLKLNERINVGTAISLRQGGLVAPALFDTDKQTLDELMLNLRQLVNRTRSGTFRSSEFSDSTITVTNLGEQGVETVIGVIYPPQVALVGFGRIYEDVSVYEGRIKGCHRVNISLSADHRSSDGMRGAKFISAIDRLMQEPEKL